MLVPTKGAKHQAMWGFRGDKKVMLRGTFVILTGLISFDWSKNDEYSFMDESVVMSLRLYPTDDMSTISL